MEISKGLQLEIQSVQSKLKNAIRDHQICVGKLKDDPNNPDILDRIQEIQVHIVSLGRCQKQVVQRLRKEVDNFKAANANEVKVSVASLLGLNNNNHITANNESTNGDISEVRVVTNGLDNVRLANNIKEDYEDIVRNGDVASHREKLLKKERSISVETLSADDEEIIEVSAEDDGREIKREMSEELLDERRIKCTEQLSFLEVLGLITTMRSTELQNRRAERKRRSTANPQFVYSNWDVPTKRKRYNYLQSAGNVPQTRQTTARLNGPSPPPISNKAPTLIVPPKSLSPPTRPLSKSLIPTQKATTRPNILRSMSESRVFPNKNSRVENGNGQSALTSTTTKTSQSTTNSKTVHIPGLPSGLTIERIEHDSPVCINCRNPGKSLEEALRVGTLSSCDNCEANYHVSCHSISSPPSRLCPKCAVKTPEVTGTIKKNDELAAASYAPGVVGKAGEDPEIDKTARGFYKIGTNARKQIIGTSRSINKLSGSTFLIPITPNTIATTISVPKSSGGKITDFDEPARLRVVESNDVSSRGSTNSGNVSYSTTIVINNQLSRSSVTYVPQPDAKNEPYSYKLPIYDNESERNEKASGIKFERRRGREADDRSSIVDESRNQEGKIIGCDGASRMFDDGKEESSIVKFAESSNKQQLRQRLDKLAGSLSESITRGWKKSSTRAVPGLTRIVQSIDKQRSVSSDHGNNDNLDELQNSSYNGGSPRRQSQEQRQSSESRNESKEENARNDRDGKSNKSEFKDKRKVEIQAENSFTGEKYRQKSPNQYHSLFAGYNKSDILTDRTIDNQWQSYEGGSSTREIPDRRNDQGQRDVDDKIVEYSRVGDRSGCFKIVSSTEHVKLEEAHLSAPSRAKLMRKNMDEIFPSRIMDSSYRSDIASRYFPNRRRTTEDRTTTSAQLFLDANDANKLERRQVPRILMRSERKSLDSRETLETTSFVDKFKSTDFQSFRKIYDNPIERLPRKENQLPEIETSSASDSSATDDASSPRSIFHGNAKTDVTSDGEKNEDKDSTSEKFERNESIDSGDNLQVDEETEDNEEDVEDEEDQDCPIVDDEIRDGGIEELRISTVSPESMQVLEQFETAMMQVENGDKTANI